MSFFRRKELPAALVVSAQPETRKYYEVWGDSIEMVQFFRKLVICLVLINIMSLILLKRSQLKPPLVIRVDDVGKAEPIQNINTLAKLTKPEVLNFTKLFMKYFLERNFYTWKENLIDAGAMMTPEFREKVNKETNFKEEGNSVEENKLTSKLNFSNIEVSRETQESIIVNMKGWRQITSYNDAQFLKETIFESEMVLKKVPRSMETPYGLLVDSYKEKIFKNE